MTLESFEGSPQYVSPMMQKPGKVALRLAPRLQGEPASGGQRPLMPAIDMPGCIGPPPGLDCGGPGGPCTSVLQPGALWTSMLSLSMLRGNHPKCPSLPFNFAAEYLSRANSQDTGKDSPSPSTSSGDAPSEWNWPQGTTSVMIRNIPNRYTTEELLEELVAKGFAGDFDFFYLPIDFETKRNKGYCFLNLHTQELARRFRQAFVSQKLERYKTMKVLEITPADTQGFDANVLKYLQQQSNRIHNPWFKPMIFLPSCVEGQPWNCLPLSLETLPARLRGQAKLSRRRKVEERADVAKLGR